MRRWDAIEAFVMVVERGSFTEAANALGVSPSHISRRMSELEMQLDTALLYRTTRSIRLSEAGELYYQECRQLLEGFLRAEERITQQQEQPVGTLKMTCGTTFGERFIAPLLPAFLKRYPKLNVELQLSNLRNDLILDGYDLAVRLGTMKDSSLLARRLCDRKEYICASPEYLASHGSPHTLEELNQHNCLQGTHPTWLFMEKEQRREIRIEGNWRSNSGPAIVEAVTAGLGIAQLPDYYVEPLLKKGELVSLLDHYCYPLSGVWLVYPKARQQLPRVTLLCDYLIEHFKTLPWKEQ